ncbi:MAG: membrane protein insertion efficiency factor YidD [Gordonia sp. (in: high G+C Gram-positive bacteria)]
MTWLYLLPRRSIIVLIELYRTWISPLRLPICRFEPTCSAYAVEALSRHGFWHGGALAILRLLKCGPWHKPGYDPVPDHGFRHPRLPRPAGGADDEVERTPALSERESHRASMEVRGN